jgi:hypothetical protein
MRNRVMMRMVYRSRVLQAVVNTTWNLIRIPGTTCTIQQYASSIPHATILDSASTVNTLIELDTHLADSDTGLSGWPRGGNQSSFP